MCIFMIACILTKCVFLCVCAYLIYVNDIALQIHCVSYFVTITLWVETSPLLCVHLIVTSNYFSVVGILSFPKVESQVVSKAPPSENTVQWIFYWHPFTTTHVGISMGLIHRVRKTGPWVICILMLTKCCHMLSEWFHSLARGSLFLVPITVFECLVCP